MVATTAVPRAVRPRARAATGERQRALWREWARSLDRPLTSYYLILGTGVLLIALGLVMVLSSTMVNSITETGSAFSMFQRQLASAAIGLPLMLLAAQAPVWIFRLVGYPAMIVSVALLLLTVFHGTEVNGAMRWLEIGGMLIQPSEPAKLAFALWGANILARKDELRELTGEFAQFVFAGQDVGAPQGEGKLGGFGGLDEHSTDLQPAHGAIDLGAVEDGEQQ